MSTYSQQIDDTLLGRCHLAFANCVLNRRFAATIAGSGSCDGFPVRPAMTKNVLSILIIFSVQLQQTEISDRKLFIFQHGKLAQTLNYTMVIRETLKVFFARITKSVNGCS